MMPLWCIECGLDLNGGEPAPGANLNPDCSYCRQRKATGRVTRNG